MLRLGAAGMIQSSVPSAPAAHRRTSAGKAVLKPPPHPTVCVVLTLVSRVEAQPGCGHLPAQTHHLPEHLLS